MVLLNRAGRIDHNNIDEWSDVAMLEAVVHYDKIDIGKLLTQTLDALYSPLANHDRDFGKFALYLQWLVTHVEI
jgi:hypothetical protein